MSEIQTRKYTIVVNNPDKFNVNSEVLIDILAKLKVTYGCFAKEIGENGTPHYHIFIYRKTAIRFNTIRNLLPFAHIEKCNGTIKENIDYVKKEGKWLNSLKAETKVEGTFVEIGTPPTEREEKSPAFAEILELIEQGKDTVEIVRENPKYLFQMNAIDNAKQRLTFDKYRNENRNLKVEYIYGPAGTGKTSSIFKRHAYKEVCRITSINNKSVMFDSYLGQPVLVFEEFASQIPIQDMLNYLDVYPVELPARYYNRTACYEKVYITSNIPLAEQYMNIQLTKPEVWRAFLRRIHKVIEYTDVGVFREVDYD